MLIIATVIMAFMQVVGIISIMPFLAIVANPEVVSENKWLAALYNYFGFGSVNAFLVFLGVGALVILMLGNVLQVITQWMNFRFIHMKSHTFSMRLLENYLEKPYIFFLNQNSSDLGKDILSEIKLIIKGLLRPIIEILSKGTVALFIIILLFIVDPILALSVVILLGGAYLLIYIKIKGTLSTLGDDRRSANQERFKAVTETFGAIKDIKLMNNQRNFLRFYEKPSLRFEKTQAKQEVYSMIPDHAIESFAFGGILIIVLYLLISGGNIAQTLPIVGLYSYSILRLKPALQHVYSSFAKLKFFQSSLDEMYDNLIQYAGARNPTEQHDDNLSPLPLRKNIQLENIHFGYPGARENLFNGLNLTIYANSSAAFIGPTGAGKSTIVDIILGLLIPDAGKILVDDIPVTPENLTQWQKNIGYVPQHIYLADDSVENNIAFGVPGKQIERDSVVRAAKMACIHDFIMEEMPDRYETLIGERGIRLSGGQRQRIGIARALYRNPEVLVLDEATSALDGKTEEYVFEAIETIAKTKTVIMIAHRLSTVRDCDTIYLLEKGNIIASGSYDHLVNTSPGFREFAKLTGKKRQSSTVSQDNTLSNVQ